MPAHRVFGAGYSAVIGDYVPKLVDCSGFGLLARSEATSSKRLHFCWLGISFQCCVVAWLLSRFGAKWGLQEAPLSKEEIDLKALDASRPTSNDEVMWREVDREQRAVVEVMRGLSYRGSEVCVSTGQLLRPMQYPSSPVDARLSAFNAV